MNEPIECPRKTIGLPGRSVAIRRLRDQRSPRHFAQPIARSEEVEFAGFRCLAVAAMVVGVDGVAGPSSALRRPAS